MQNNQQVAKAEIFRTLHFGNEMLLLPNVWDVLTAKLMENMKFPAIATASAAISYSNGYADGENFPLSDLNVLLKRIVKAVNIPVTADIESGYATDLSALEKNLIQIISTGIAGVNIEDTNPKTKEIYSIEEQAERIKLIREVANRMGVPIFINAKTDVYLSKYVNEVDRVHETIKRGVAYKMAGADGLYPIAITSSESISAIIHETKLPINILAFKDAPSLKILDNIGVARVSIASGLLKSGTDAIIKSANNFKNLQDYSTILSSEITGAYLNQIIKSNQ